MERRTCVTCRFGSMCCPVLPCSGCKKEGGDGYSEWSPVTNGDFIRALDNRTMSEWLVKLFGGEGDDPMIPAIEAFLNSPHEKKEDESK